MDKEEWEKLLSRLRAEKERRTGVFIGGIVATFTLCMFTVYARRER